jgi:hypothetical protein
LAWDTHYPPDEQENWRGLLRWKRMNEEPPVLEAWAMLWRHEDMSHFSESRLAQ